MLFLLNSLCVGVAKQNVICMLLFSPEKGEKAAERCRRRCKRVAGMKGGRRKRRCGEDDNRNLSEFYHLGSEERGLFVV